jgi:hypothetical protein
MRNAIAILILFTGIMACKKKDKIPGDILPPDKMQWVLWDIIRADEFQKTYVFPFDSSLDKKTEQEKIYQQVFDIHKISEEKFEKSFSFYRAHPDLLKKMLDSLNLAVSGSGLEQTLPPRIKDSTRLPSLPSTQ